MNPMAALLLRRQAERARRGHRLQPRRLRRPRQQRPGRQVRQHRQPRRRLHQQALRRRARGDVGDDGRALLDALRGASAATVAELYDAREFGKALREIMALADASTATFDQHKPWQLAKDPARAARLHDVCSRALHRGLPAAHGLPHSRCCRRCAGSVARASFGLAPRFAWDDAARAGDHAIAPYQHLMQRVDPKQLDALFEPRPTAVASRRPPPRARDRPAPARRRADRARRSRSTISPRSTCASRRSSPARRSRARPSCCSLTLDVGEARTRNVFSGIQSAYEPEQLVGKLTVMVANLAPRKMKFGVSEGMVLAASHADEKADPGLYVLEPHGRARCRACAFAERWRSVRRRRCRRHRSTRAHVRRPTRGATTGRRGTSRPWSSPARCSRSRSSRSR